MSGMYRGRIRRWAADDWFSKCIRERAGHECEHCHKPATDCAHIAGRSDFTVRWCTLNAVALCRHCHDQFGKQPIDFIDWIDSQWPDRRQGIQIRRQGRLKNSARNRQLVSDHYRSQYRAMQADPSHQLESWN